MEANCMFDVPYHSISLDNKKNEHHSQTIEPRDLLDQMAAAELLSRKTRMPRKQCSMKESSELPALYG
jgi:hypothetical protein